MRYILTTDRVLDLSTASSVPPGDYLCPVGVEAFGVAVWLPYSHDRQTCYSRALQAVALYCPQALAVWGRALARGCWSRAYSPYTKENTGSQTGSESTPT